MKNKLLLIIGIIGLLPIDIFGCMHIAKLLSTDTPGVVFSILLAISVTLIFLFLGAYESIVSKRILQAYEAVDIEEVVLENLKEEVKRQQFNPAKAYTDVNYEEINNIKT